MDELLYLDYGGLQRYHELIQLAIKDAASSVSYDGTNKKLIKTVNGTAADIVSAATIVSDGLAAGSRPYWANIKSTTSANYITEPEIKSVKINGSSTNAASTQNCSIQYDTTNKCLKFIFN